MEHLTRSRPLSRDGSTAGDPIHASSLASAPAAGPVVIGLDGSPNSWTALHWAAQRAHDLGVALRIVTGRDHDPNKAPARSLFIRAAAEVGTRHPDLAVESVEGVHPAGDALALAGRTAECIVIGAPVWDDERDLGGATATLLAHATRPTVVVPARSAPVPARRPVLVGLDTSSRGLAAVEEAFAEAERTGLPLIALHVSPPSHAPGPLATDSPGQASKLMEPVRRRHPGVQVSRTTGRGDPAEVLIAAAQEASMLFIGTTGSGRAQRLGSTGRRLVNRAPVPVVVVPPRHLC